MESLYAKGVRRALIYYFGGLLTAILFHLVVGVENKTMMPKSTIVLLFTLMGALPWLTLNIINLANRFTDSQNRGELFVHCAILLVVAIIFMAKIF
jgi:hypothetical protein